MINTVNTALEIAIITIKLHVCVHVKWQVSGSQGKHWLISQMNSLEATGSAQLNVHTTVLAAGKNTSLLSRLDKIEIEI